MMIARYLITALFVATAARGLFADPAPKAERTAQLTAVVSRIDAIARDGYTDAKWPLVRKQIDAISAPDDLRSLVIVLYGLLTPQKGDESYDFAFEAAIRASVLKLAAIPTQESSVALRSLQPVIGLDASLGLQEAIDQQAKLLKDHVP